MDQCLNFKDLNHAAPQTYLIGHAKVWLACTNYSTKESCLKISTFPVAWVSLVLAHKLFNSWHFDSATYTLPLRKPNQNFSFLKKYFNRAIWFFF